MDHESRTELERFIQNSLCIGRPITQTGNQKVLRTPIDVISMLQVSFHTYLTGWYLVEDGDTRNPLEPLAEFHFHNGGLIYGLDGKQLIYPVIQKGENGIVVQYQTHIKPPPYVLGWHLQDQRDLNPNDPVVTRKIMPRFLHNGERRLMVYAEEQTKCVLERILRDLEKRVESLSMI